MDNSYLRVGQKVHYQPPHYAEEDQFENGIVKSIPESKDMRQFVRVVYHCDNQWDRYADFTSELTHIDDIKEGWR